MMKGLELAKNYYETYARPMLHKKYPEYESRIAVGPSSVVVLGKFRRFPFPI